MKQKIFSIQLKKTCVAVNILLGKWYQFHINKVHGIDLKTYIEYGCKSMQKPYDSLYEIGNHWEPNK